MRTSRLLCLLMLFSTFHVATCQEVVKIYSTLSDRRVEQGTGFFTTDHGQVLTAYHVVMGAKKIKVTHEHLGPFTDVRVEFVSPVYDTAVLQILPPPPTTPFLKLSNYAPRVADDLRVQGFPKGAPSAEQLTHAARDGFLKSMRLNDEQGSRLFAADIDIIYLWAIIHPGMSGGPVLHRGQAIGILSGSLVEGGSITWAIPSGYVTDPNFLTKVGQRPSEIAWAKFQLMDPSGWKSLRSMVRVNPAAAAISDGYFDEVETLAKTYDDLYKQAWATRQAMVQWRPYLDRVITDHSLANDPKTAEKLMRGPAGRAAVESLNQFSELCGSAGKAGEQLAATLNKLSVRVTEESNLDQRSGQELARKIKAIRDQHAEMLHGIDAYLKTDTSAIRQSEPELELALSRSRAPADEAKALQRYLDVWQPYVEAFTSFQALTFMNTSTTTMRQIGQLLEPIVYPTDAAR